ncbi:MAG: radical SAM protein, partial [Candidatus Hydrogenedentes bacterium]|nr:radical SAM protein [Candidatus Hydrogenedentota bacterium]
MATASRSFQVMVKPIGAVCNLDCAYCYYLEKKDLYPKGRSFRMADDLLESYIIQHIEACPDELILFSWHGGEPTVLGLDYFRRIVELQRRHRPPGRRILNGIQTNGTLLDEEWCRFLAAERFQIGISVDGPRELHDPYRVTKSGKSTHNQVMRSFRLLKRHGVECDMLCVVHQKNVRHPALVYRFFRDSGVKFLQFLPLVARQGETGVSAETVPAEAYGVFLSTVFGEWIKHDVGRIAIQNFDEALRPFLGID